MPRGPVRRGQLISPFGPGAMMILPDGVSVICGGLDHWFKHESGDTENIDQREYQVDEWRLAARLNAAHFSFRQITAACAAPILRQTAISLFHSYDFPNGITAPVVD